MQKLLTIVNWAAVGGLVVFLVMALIDVQNPPRGSDAAGRGMAWFYVVVAAGLLVVLLVLNFLPHGWAKYVGLAVILLPVAVIWFDGAYIKFKNYLDSDPTDSDGSRYFADPQRRAIAKAIAYDEVDELEKLLAGPVPLINDSQNSEQLTLLDYAARSYSRYNTRYNKDWPTTQRKLELLLAAGAAINSQDSARLSTHALTITEGPADMLRFFLDHGADPKASGSRRLNLLFEAILTSNEPVEKARILLDHGVDVNGTGTFDAESERYSPLLLAARIQRWNVCPLLIQRGANVHYKAPNGKTFAECVTQTEASYREVQSTPPDDFKVVKALITKR